MVLEEVICSVASVCVLVGPTDLKFSTHIKDDHISNDVEDQGYRSKVTKVKNLKIPVFSPVSEKVFQGQGHKGRGHKECTKVKVKVGWGVLYPIDSQEVHHTGFSIKIIPGK